MPALEAIDVWMNVERHSWKQAEIKRSFTVRIEIRDGERVVTTDNITPLPEETKASPIVAEQ